MKKYPKYDVLDIPVPKEGVVEKSTHTFIENEWMVCVDGPSETAWEVNRKTGERRPYDYAKAMREIALGRK